MTVIFNQFDKNVLIWEDLGLRTTLPFVRSKPRKTSLEKKLLKLHHDKKGRGGP